MIPNPDGSRNTTEYEWKAAGYVSVDYTIDPKSSISAVYTYNGDGNRSYYDRHIQRRLPSANIDDIVHRDERTYRKGEEHSLGLFYRNTRGRVKFDTDFNYLLKWSILL